MEPWTVAAKMQLDGAWSHPVQKTTRGQRCMHERVVRAAKRFLLVFSLSFFSLFFLFFLFFSFPSLPAKRQVIIKPKSTTTTPARSASERPAPRQMELGSLLPRQAPATLLERRSDRTCVPLLFGPGKGSRATLPPPPQRMTSCRSPGASRTLQQRITTIARYTRGPPHVRCTPDVVREIRVS